MNSFPPESHTSKYSIPPPDHIQMNSNILNQNWDDQQENEDSIIECYLYYVIFWILLSPIIYGIFQIVL
jgi:hypothetical protein